ncbi:hemolysin family protein [Stratiformator vulcanicus]|uniref:Magnesium and cobalt efflux protein CorC n=1 Tax=Stratiformator vulcanicus TaxID=2527980 RepID=A0A517R6M2_9PLAN|nr:hemolysin family protein [Stratiformator vulcanicus]QDT39505.1 Magnesium and cobalt efflux protein CorC [Stratiformator vulcanicus]
MTLLPPVAAGFTLLSLFIVSFAARSLRNFSRSRLGEISEQRDLLDRGSEILRQHGEVEADLSGLKVALLGLFGACCAAWFGPPFDVEGVAILAAGEWLLAIGTLTITTALLPSIFGTIYGESFLVSWWPFITLLLRMIYPFRIVAERVERLLNRMAGRPDPERSDAAELISQELKSVVDIGQREGVIESGAGTMIARVIELREGDAENVMTPRTEMIVLSADVTVDEARQAFVDEGHSRLPVIGDSIDDVLGILYAKDLLKALDGNGGHEINIRDILREAVFVPESTGIDALLERMKKSGVHMVIVVDEYGGVAGLATLEDVLEEIVGDIFDEFDDEERESPAVIRVDNDTLDVEARVHIDDLNEEYGLDLPEDGDYDTVGGFVYDQLGKVPDIGETFSWNDLRVDVTDADHRRVLRVRIHSRTPVNSGSNGQG